MNRSLLINFSNRTCGCLRPAQYLGITGNHGNDRKINKSHQILNARDINKLCLRKTSLHKAVIIKCSVDSAFLSMLYGKKQKRGNAGNQQ